MQIQTIRPGLLVSLSTEIKGGVSYEREEIQAEHVTEDGAKEAEWKTRKRVADADEHERATKARGKARSLIVAQCAQSRHGLLCPVANEGKLAGAIEEARAIADAFNASAIRTRIEVYVVCGRVADSDVEAQKAINAEVRGLLDSMKAAIAAADVKSIRDAADRARELGGILSADVTGKVKDAIDQARRAAREIVKRVQKEGESAAIVVEKLKVDAIEAARFAFLDMDATAPVQASAPAVAAIDLDTVPEPTPELDSAGQIPGGDSKTYSRSGAAIEF